jgi:Family of unknown function (DUF6152)
MDNRRVNPFLVLAVLAGFSLSPGPAIAHHGEAAYETAKRLTVRATMTEFKWVNPHCQLRFDVSDDKGNKQHWNVQAINPLMLSRYGWTRDSLKPGDMVTVVFRPAKNGEMTGILDRVVLANGRELLGRQSVY